MYEASQILQYANFPEPIKSTAIQIINIKIQGATNVAINSLKAIIDWLKTKPEIKEPNKLLDTALFYLEFLANARPNEPLAKNALKFIKFKTANKTYGNTIEVRQDLEKFAHEYLNIIKDSKKHIIEHGRKKLKNVNIIFTHCHSSTAETLIEHINQQHKVQVIATETRPLYQGRITTTNLLKHGVKTIMIVDSAAASFITDDSILPVDVILIGSDEITAYGDAINKVGSFGIALASHFAGKPLYVVTPSLKMYYQTLIQRPTIEQRDAKEVWPQAPKGLTIINPAFELIPRNLITGFITEFGIIKPEDLMDTVLNAYPWVK